MPVLAVRVADCAVVTEDMFAANAALLAPSGTVIAAGTVTEVLLLAKFTVNPPLAAALRVTVQASVPAPVIDPFVQLRPLRTGTPVPLRLIVDAVPVDELLVRVNWPAVTPAPVGLN